MEFWTFCPRHRHFLSAGAIPQQPFRYRRVILAMQVERLFLVSFSVKIRHRDQVALIDAAEEYRVESERIEVPG